MSRTTAQRRLDVVAQTVRGLPYHKTGIDRAYARLLQVGELPDDDRLAWIVLERALYARRETVEGRHFEGAAVPGGPIDGPPRRRVFREAVHAFEPARVAARQLIAMLVASGADPTDAEFIPSDLVIPEFGGVAMHILGWPDQWVREPYAGQMQRVLRQHAQIRARIGANEAWHDEAAADLGAFLSRGELPADATTRLFALTIGEMFAIHADFLGRGDEYLLAAYEAVATTTGHAQANALEHLCQLQARAEARR